jgi:putative glycolipid-binding protein
MGGRARNERLLDLFKQFLQKLVDLVPGAFIQRTPNETTWYVAQRTRDHYIAADALLADDSRKGGWIHAIADFQILWRRLDIPGHDACRLVKRDDAWRIEGTAVYRHEAGAAALVYTLDCDREWRTREGVVNGW